MLKRILSSDFLLRVLTLSNMTLTEVGSHTYEFKVRILTLRDIFFHLFLKYNFHMSLFHKTPQRPAKLSHGNLILLYDDALIAIFLADSEFPFSNYRKYVQTKKI